MSSVQHTRMLCEMEDSPGDSDVPCVPSFLGRPTGRPLPRPRPPLGLPLGMMLVWLDVCRSYVLVLGLLYVVGLCVPTTAGENLERV